MRNRRTVLPVLCAILAVVALLLVGCGGSDFSSSDGQAIKDDVSSRLDELKSGSGDSVQLVEDTLSGYVGSQLDDMGLSASDVVSTYLQGFDYELGDVTGSGGSATCKVKLTCRSVTEIVADFQARSKGLSGSDAGAALLQCISDAPLESEEADAYCQKGSDGTWNCLDGLKKALIKLCF